MWNIQNASNYLAAKIALILKFDEDFEEVLAYGAFVILHTFWSIVFTLIFGFIFKVPMEAVIISFAASILRKNSGGVHASTPNRCIAIATTVFVIIALFINQLVSLSMVVSIVYCSSGFAFSYYIVYKKAPKDTPNKPITEEAMKNHLRSKAIKTIHIFLLLSIILLFMYSKGKHEYLLKIMLSLVSGVLWQSITLTNLGSLIVSNLDSLLEKIACLVGGEK
ncbi:Accessory gene regulator B [Alkaliphilus metalliredigens QYMF]|uniref:Accessory gene regulator B n=2 Tax=Alkaliphilus TaxID=114627 RepID=A6TMR8_ALKMQ|nr:Accessory gene regulator B [Alkaliphilus metalliredigens QYMF]